MATDSPEPRGEASSIHSRPRNEPFRSREDLADRTALPASLKTHASPQTFKCWQDGIKESEVEDFVHEPQRPSPLQSRMFRHIDADCAAWTSPSGPKCPASFGDHGTTATAGAFGQLVQFSAHLGAGNSGMFSAGHRYTEWPYSVTGRAEDLLSFASESFENAQKEIYSNVFGLKFLDLMPAREGYPPPRLKWFKYRWPRYVYRRLNPNGIGNIQLTIQFIVRDNTVFQQCILENRGQAVTLGLAFCKGMRICDLDHLTDDYAFNKTISDQQNAGPGPGGFGWIHVNRFHEGSSGAQTDSQHPSHDQISNRNNFNRNQVKSDFGVAVVASMAVNGRIMRFCPGESAHIWHEALGARSKLEIVTAYKLVRLTTPLNDWKSFVVPCKEMNMNHFLGETKAVLLFRNPITRMSRKDGLRSNQNKRGSESMQRDQSLNEVDVVNAAQDRMTTAESQPQTKPFESRAVGHGPTLERTSPIMDRIEFTIRRNLQHILDVCTIPVAVRLSREDPGDLIWQKLRGVQAVALSCGDLSGHRICTTSSFFAFQFLAEVAQRLSRLPQPDRDDTQVKALFSRIKEVCLGHLKWLYASEKNDQDEAFGSLYWVSGEAVTVPDSSDSWAPRDHPRDTAFQILKAIEFANAFANNEDGDPSLIRQLIRRWGQRWVRWLKRSDRRESFVWRHTEDQGVGWFRLDDQIWIWRALKAMEHENYGAWAILDGGVPHRGKGTPAGPGAFDTHRSLRRSRKFASWTIQRETLLKFTTDHEIIRKKMIALSRSPRETRFLLHARDTAIFYGEDMGLFSEDTALRQAWKSTLDAQRFHENNQEAMWDNALRYGLAIMLGTRGHQINNRKPGHMVRVATEVLLRSSSENGLFPGRLNIAAKSPLDGMFYREKDADSCYEASFEIPYIFLTHSEAIEGVELSNPFHTGPEVEILPTNASFSRDPTLKSLNSPEAMAAHRTSNPQIQLNQREETNLPEWITQLSDTLKVIPFLPKSTSSTEITRSGELSGAARLTLKKSMPFGNIADSHNIVEIEDEWLFNYPDFFHSILEDRISIGDTLDSMENSDATWLKSIDVPSMRWKYSSHDDKDGRGDDESTASSHGSSSYSNSSSSSHDSSSATSDSNSPISRENSTGPGGAGDSGLTVLDISSRKLRQRKALKNATQRISGSFENIWKHISRPRTAAKAKKRTIIWNPPGTDPSLELEAALLCYSASKGDEKKDMLEFFERHFQRWNFIFDHCDRAYNTWETEVHLSFFILQDASGSLSAEATLPFEKFPEVQGQHISRGSIGIRFFGDAFDRYWTIHIFSSVSPEKVKVERKRNIISTLLDQDDTLVSGQRKALELVVFGNMLHTVATTTQMILEEVRSEMGIQSGAFSWSVPSMDTYSSWHRAWEGFAPLLQALADDLISAQDIAGQWETREAARGQDRPRWTRNDEKKYRTEITRAQRQLSWRKKRIQEALKDVESLQTACAARLANAREELQFRSNQNIASFTYVTIVFLPLGFAASVFSMNGYPDAGWVASMTVIAVVTLAITATALANAKLLLGVAEQLSKDALRFTGTVFQSSLIGQQQRRRRDELVEPNEPSNGNPKAGEPLDGRTMRHVLFWMAYLLIELPARRVALACRELSASSRQTLGSLNSDARPAGSVGSSDGTSTNRASTDRASTDRASTDRTSTDWTSTHSTSTDRLSTTSAASPFRKGVRIAGGILLLPLLLVSWSIQLLFYNVLDILVFLGQLVKRTFRALLTLSDANGSASNTKILTWLIDPPSLLRPMRNVMSSDQKDKKSSAQVNTSVASDRGDPGPKEEV